MKNYSTFTMENPKSVCAEAYRMLRTNMQFANVDQSLNSILFTSSGSGEGKSSIVSNLGVSVAQSGKRVLIIDADLRNPGQHKIFLQANDVGLSMTLVENVPSLNYVVHVSQKGLDLLTSGPIPPNPADLLSSKRMKQILEEARLAYDVVFIDSPPTIAVTDSSILAQAVDGVVLVLSSGEVSKEYAVRAKEQLEKVGANIIGTILNKVKMKTRDHYYYNYQSRQASI